MASESKWSGAARHAANSNSADEIDLDALLRASNSSHPPPPPSDPRQETELWAPLSSGLTSLAPPVQPREARGVSVGLVAVGGLVALAAIGLAFVGGARLAVGMASASLQAPVPSPVVAPPDPEQLPSPSAVGVAPATATAPAAPTVVRREPANNRDAHATATRSAARPARTSAEETHAPVPEVPLAPAADEPHLLADAASLAAAAVADAPANEATAAANAEALAPEAEVAVEAVPEAPAAPPSLNALMAGSTSAAPAPNTTASAPAAPPAPAIVAAPTAEAEAPALPSRADVRRALAPVGPALRSCTEHRGVAMMNITVSGSGQVIAASAVGPWASTAPTSCVRQAAARASFPRFAQSTFTVRYPFQL